MATTCLEQLLRHLPSRDEEPTPGKHQGFTVGNERKTPSIKILGGDLGSFKRLMQKTSGFFRDFFPSFWENGRFWELGWWWEVSITIPLYPVSLEKQQEETGGILAGRNSLVWESKNEVE